MRLALLFITSLTGWSQFTPTIAQTPLPAAYQRFAAATTDTGRVAALMPVFRYRLNATTDFAGAKPVLDSVSRYAQRSGDPRSILRVLSAEGGYHRMTNNWDAALSKYLAALQIAEQLNNKSRIGVLCYNIAALYDDQQDTTNQRVYLEKTERMARETDDLALMADVYGELGKCAGKRQELDKAETYFRQCREYYRKAGAPDPAIWFDSGLWLSQCYIEQKKYPAARIQLDSVLAEIRQQPFPAFLCQTLAFKARVYRETGAADKALPLAQEAAALSDSVGNPQMQELVYDEYYRTLQAAGRYAEAVKVLEKKMALHDQVLSEAAQRNMVMAEARYQNQKKQQEIDTLKRTRQRNYALIALLLSTAIIALLAYNRSRLKLRLETQRKKLLDEELRHAKAMLQEFTDRLIEKNTIMESMQPGASKDAEQPDPEAFQQLLDTTILTGDDWERFKTLFERVYPDYLARIQRQFSDLSAGDTRLMAIARLGLSQKSAAAMLGISPESVRKARQRLRKKINLSEEQNLEGYVEGL